MNTKPYLYIPTILTAFTLSAWLTTKALYFLIHALVADQIDSFGSQNRVNQAAIVLIELGLIHWCNRIRQFVVKELLFNYPKPLERYFTAIVLYVSTVWLGCLLYLCYHLWGTPAVYELDIVVELLVLTLWIAVLLGAAIPFSAMRCWLHVVGRGRGKL